MERSFSPWRKKGEGIGKLLEMVSSLVSPLFCYWGWERGAAEVALSLVTFYSSNLRTLIKKIFNILPPYWC
jgi:hypothetical protein